MSQVKNELENYSVAKLAEIVESYDDIKVIVPYETMYLRSAKEQVKEFLFIACTELVTSAVVQRLKFDLNIE